MFEIAATRVVARGPALRPSDQAESNSRHQQTQESALSIRFRSRRSVKSLVRYRLNTGRMSQVYTIGECLAKPDTWSTFKCARSHRRVRAAARGRVLVAATALIRMGRRPEGVRREVALDGHHRCLDCFRRG